MLGVCAVVGDVFEPYASVGREKAVFGHKRALGHLEGVGEGRVCDGSVR